MVALVISVVFFLLQGVGRQKILVLRTGGLLLAIVAFGRTTSLYALNFILKSSIYSTGERSGDSISRIYVDSPGTGSGTGSDIVPTKELITFHGDFTLIALHFYLIDNLDILFSKFSRVIHSDKKIQSIWDEKVVLGLVHKDKKVGTDMSSLNWHILEPGRISNPLSIIWSVFVFLCGPFPFIGDPGIAVFVASHESLLWWAFHTLVLFQFIRLRKTKPLQDPPVLFTLIFTFGIVLFSALVEVNLGTSFRHRSIL